MNVDVDDLADTLRRHGARSTRARQLVWDALHAADDHSTVQQLVDEVQRHDGNVNVSSVYRALELFAELGLVRESRTNPMGSTTWELRHGDGEIHLVCTDCERVLHHRSPRVEQLRADLAAVNFVPDEIDVRVTGRCAACSGGTETPG